MKVHGLSVIKMLSYKNKKPILLLAMFLLSCVTIAIAQESRTINGQITESVTGKPGVGVTVLLKGTAIGTTSNERGNFALKIPANRNNGTLVFSSVSYETQEVAINNQSVVNVSLQPKVTGMSDVVVVGYGKQRKVNLTGSVGVVTSKDIESKPVASALEALQGTMPGMIIQQNSSEPGSGLDLKIRGVGSINSSTYPLVIVDGMQGNLSSINPNDIESISVLKDAASAAIYGSRAANGVILVTTKRGGKDQKTIVTYNGMYGFQKPTRMPDFADSWEYAEMYNEALVNSGFLPKYTPEDIRNFRENGPNDHWLLDLYKNRTPEASHNISVQGGTAKSGYLLSLGYLDQNSMFKGPDFGLKRYNARLNLNTQVTNKLNLGGQIAYTRNNIREHAFWSDWLIHLATRRPPVYPIKDSLGNYLIYEAGDNNPLARLEKGGERVYGNDQVNGNVNGEYAILKDLKLKGMFGITIDNNRTHEFRKAIDYVSYVGGVGADNISQVSESFARTFSMSSNATLDYQKTLGDHNLAAMVGISSESAKWSGFGATGKNIIGNKYGTIDNAANVQRNDVYGNAPAEWALNSIFGRVNYNYLNRYLVEANFRYDGSSRFKKGQRWGMFPSISAGWRVSEEKFMESTKDWLDQLKLRASWGKLGNQDVSSIYPYVRNVTIGSSAYVFGDAPAAGAYFSEANPDVTWESTSMFNFGIDAAILKNKLSVTFDCYSKLTSNALLTDMPISGTFGSGAPLTNAAKIRNQGWELTATYKANTGQFKHTVTANVSDNVNAVVEIPGGERIYGYDIVSIIKEGYPINSYYAYRNDGVFQNSAEVDKGPKPASMTIYPGDLRYVDRNGDGEIDPDHDRFVLGNPFPRYTFGLNYNVAYKGFDLTVFLQGVGKRSVWIRGEGVEAFHHVFDGPVMNWHLDRWTPNNPDGSYPRLTVGAGKNNTLNSDFWIFNAAYLRLKNVQLGYTLPKLSLINKAGIQSCRVYLTGQNLWTLTKLKAGYDPESYDANTAGSGRVYPVSRVMSVGLDVKF